MKSHVSFGDHHIYKYDLYPKFQDYFKTLFKLNDLRKLHTSKYDFDGKDTELHKIFYQDIKNNNKFKTIYCNLIKIIHRTLFNTEDALIYQSFPSLRLQFKNCIVVPPHKDSDHIGNHPIGEKNFIVPITKMFGTNTIFIESLEDKGDFRGIDLEIDELFYFNGNKCTHYNQRNHEEYIRISLDFRVITLDSYMKYITSTGINLTKPTGRLPTNMTIGAYYQVYFPYNNHFDIMDWYKTIAPIPQMKPKIGVQEAQACYDYIMSGGYLTEYKRTEELENKLAEYIGCKHCVMTTSGTMAIVLALQALGIGSGDDVVVPNYTMIATVNAIKFVGANPIIVDVNPETFTLDVDSIKEYPGCKAIVYVSLNNRAKDLNSIAKFCKNNNIILVEDSAQSLGCRIGEKHIGTFGIIGCFSLSSPKIITTGQGGFVVTNDDKLSIVLRQLKNFGRLTDGVDEYVRPGLNLKFTDLQATIGLCQFQHLSNRVEKIQIIYEWYGMYLEQNTLLISPTHTEWIPWFIDILLPCCVERADFIRYMKNHDITVRSTYPIISNDDDYPNTRIITSRGVFLPSYTELQIEDVRHICSLVNIFLKIHKIISS